MHVTSQYLQRARCNIVATGSNANMDLPAAVLCHKNVQHHRNSEPAKRHISVKAALFHDYVACALVVAGYPQNGNITDEKHILSQGLT